MIPPVPDAPLAQEVSVDAHGDMHAVLLVEAFGGFRVEG